MSALTRLCGDSSYPPIHTIIAKCRRDFELVKFECDIISLNISYMNVHVLPGLRYDNRKFNAGVILFEENQYKKKMAFQVLSCVFGLLLVEIR